MADKIGWLLALVVAVACIALVGFHIYRRGPLRRRKVYHQFIDHYNALYAAVSKAVDALSQRVDDSETEESLEALNKALSEDMELARPLWAARENLLKSQYAMISAAPLQLTNAATRQLFALDRFAAEVSKLIVDPDRPIPRDLRGQAERAYDRKGLEELSQQMEKELLGFWSFSTDALEP